MYITTMGVCNKKLTLIKQDKTASYKSGSINVDRVVFNFSGDEWETLTKVAVFVTAKGNSYNVPLIGDYADIPKEIYANNYQDVSIGVYGYLTEEVENPDTHENEEKLVEVLPTNLVMLPIEEGAYKNGATPSGFPTPSQWEIYLAEVSAMANQVASDKDDVNELAEALDREVNHIIEQLENGDFDGRGIISIEKTATVGLVDTYTITYTDNTISTFYVTNGKDGEPGTTDYSECTNKPQINGHELVGNQSSADLGIDGEVNVIEKIEVNDVEQTVANKTVNISVPTSTSQLNNDSGFIDNAVDNLIYYTLKTNTGSLIDLEINGTTYVITLSLKDQDGNVISTDTIDLPLESVVVSGRYDNNTKKVILTLENGSEVDFSVADLVAGLQTEITSQNKLASDLVDDSNSGNKFVTTSEKLTWNAKYDKPSGGIPSTDMTEAVQTSLGKADTAIQNTDYASTSIGGVIKTSEASYGTKMSSGFLTSTARTYSQYNSAGNALFISKGTLENVITGKNLETANNKVNSISSDSTDTQYPSAKCVYDNFATRDTEYNTFKKLYESNLNSANKIITGSGQVTDSSNLSIKRLNSVGGDTLSQDTTKLTYKCVGTETGDYYFVYSSTNYQFTMPTISAGSVLVFDTTSLKLYLGTTEISTTTASTGTLITLSGTPNPDYPQPVKSFSGNVSVGVSNKNLLDSSTIVVGQLNTAGTFTPTATGWRTTDYIAINNTLSYMFSWKPLNSSINYWPANAVYYDSDKNHISGVALTSYPGSGVFYQSISSIPNNASYLRISHRNNGDYEKTNLQLEQGSSATSYIAHAGQTFPLTIPANMPLGNIIGSGNITYKNIFFKNTPNNPNYNSELTENAWYYYKKWAKTTITNINDIGIAGTGNINVVFATIKKPTDCIDYDKYSFVNAKYSHATYKYVSTADSANRINHIYGDGAKDRYWIGFAPATTVEVMREKLVNSELNYVLANPEYIPITDTTLINQLQALSQFLTYKNITNFSITGGDIDGVLDFEYYVDDNVTMHNYVDAQIGDAIGGSY